MEKKERGRLQPESWANAIRPFTTDFRSETQFVVPVCNRSFVVAKKITNQFLGTTCGSQCRSSKTSECVEAQHTCFAGAVTKGTLAWRTPVAEQKAAAFVGKLCDTLGCG